MQPESRPRCVFQSPSSNRYRLDIARKLSIASCILLVPKNKFTACKCAHGLPPGADRNSTGEDFRLTAPPHLAGVNRQWTS